MTGGRYADMQEIEAPEEYIRIAGEDKEQEAVTSYGYRYKTYTYKKMYTAAVEGGILKVSVYTRTGLMEGSRKPACTIFIDREKEHWKTRSGDQWTESMIDNIGNIYGSAIDVRWKYDEFIDPREYAPEEVKELVRNYLEETGSSICGMIRNYQRERNGRILQKKHRKEMEDIDAWMRKVPEEPESFRRWLRDTLYDDERVLFYKKRGRKSMCRCMYCDAVMTMPAKVTVHNAAGICESCKKTVIYKSYGKQRAIRKQKSAILLQKADKGFWLRLYVTSQAFERTGLLDDWQIHTGREETVRVFYGNDAIPKRAFIFDIWKNEYGNRRWCNTKIDPGYVGVLFPGTANDAVKDTVLKYMPLQSIAARSLKHIPVSRIIHRLQEHPAFEYVIKGGFYRLFMQELEWYSGCDYRYNARTLQDFLKISKSRLREIAGKDITSRLLRLIRYADATGASVTIEQLETMEPWGERTAERVISLIPQTTAHKLLRYIMEQVGDRPTDYIDYIMEMRELGRKITKDTMYPQRFQQAHEESTRELQQIRDMREKEQKRQQDLIYSEMMAGQQELLKYEDDRFSIVIPGSEEDFKKEGREQHNCVATYFKRVLKGECTVLFLRMREKPEEPFCTVEIRGTELRQCRTKFNREAPPEAMAFMEKYLKVLEKRIREKNKKKRKAG